MNSLNSTKIKNAKDSGIDKNSMSDIKSNKQIESELSSSTISKHSGVNNMIIEKNETREINEAGIYMDNSLASKLSNLDENKENDTNKHNEYKSKNSIDKNFLKTVDSKGNLNDDKLKMVQTLTKIFNLNIDKNLIQLQVNNEYLDSEKKIIHLKQRVEDTEKNNKEYYKKCGEKEKEYLDKIAHLEKKMTIFDKADVVMLQKQNDDYEIQIANLNRTIQHTTLKQSQDIEKYSNLIDELTTLKNRLNLELDLTLKIKSKLIEIKNKQYADENKTNLESQMIVSNNDLQISKDINDNINKDKETKRKIIPNINNNRSKPHRKKPHFI